PASNIQAALVALGNIGSGNATVTAIASSGANNQIFQVTFVSALAGLPQPVMSVNSSGLTASANVALGSVSTTTAGGPGLTINAGATLTLDNTAVNSSNRLSASATVVFNGGTLKVLGAGGAASAVTVGAALFNAGNSTIQSTAGAGSGSSVTLIASAVGRTAGA